MLWQFQEQPPSTNKQWSTTQQIGMLQNRIPIYYEVVEVVEAINRRPYYIDNTDADMTPYKLNSLDKVRQRLRTMYGEVLAPKLYV